MLSRSTKQFVFTNILKPSAIATSFRHENLFNEVTETNIIKSKVPDINIPKIDLNEYIWRNLDKWNYKTAVVCAETGRKYLYSELYKKSRALANFLYNLKMLKKGDTVAIVLPNVPEYLIVLLGAIQAGLKVTLVNPSYTTDELARQFIDSETKIIFTLTELWPNVKNASNTAKLKKEEDVPIVVINHQQENQSTPRGAIKFDEIVNGTHNLQFQLNVNYEDVIILPYSSGTTGLPKGVGLTTKNIVSNLHQLNGEGFRIHKETEGSDRDVAPAILPMFHVMGLTVVCLNLIAAGCKLITVPKFGSSIFLDVLENHKLSIAFLVPPIMLLLLNIPNVLPRHLIPLRTIASGAAPLGAADCERLHKKSKGRVAILQGYGLTETCSSTHQQTISIANGVKFGGCGFLLPNAKSKIMSIEDENHRKPLGPNQSGELFIRGPQVMKGYHNNLKATEEVLDSKGWFRTGDIAHYDEDGHFFITDRLKELIKVKGFQVAPAELEELLRDHPQVEDAAVVGVPHDEYGEVPKAFVVLKKDSIIKTARIHEYIAVKVSKHKHLVGGIVITDSIPKNASGKILRRQLKNL